MTTTLKKIFKNLFCNGEMNFNLTVNELSGYVNSYGLKQLQVFHLRLPGREKKRKILRLCWTLLSTGVNHHQLRDQDLMKCLHFWYYEVKTEKIVNFTTLRRKKMQLFMTQNMKI